VERDQDPDDPERERDQRLREGVDRPRHRFAVDLAELGRVGVPERRGDERERARQQEQRDEREDAHPELQREEPEPRPRRPGVGVLPDAAERPVGVGEVVGAQEARSEQGVREATLEPRGESGAHQGREQDHEPDEDDRERHSDRDAEREQRRVDEPEGDRDQEVEQVSVRSPVGDDTDDREGGGLTEGGHTRSKTVLPST
jgi:hypothetical protein